MNPVVVKQKNIQGFIYMETFDHFKPKNTRKPFQAEKAHKKPCKILPCIFVISRNNLKCDMYFLTEILFHISSELQCL